jgi:hypothetical protein
MNMRSLELPVSDWKRPNGIDAVLQFIIRTESISERSAIVVAARIHANVCGTDQWRGKHGSLSLQPLPALAIFER